MKNFSSGLEVKYGVQNSSQQEFWGGQGDSGARQEMRISNVKQKIFPNDALGIISLVVLNWYSIKK